MCTVVVVWWFNLVTARNSVKVVSEVRQRSEWFYCHKRTNFCLTTLNVKTWTDSIGVDTGSEVKLGDWCYKEESRGLDPRLAQHWKFWDVPPASRAHKVPSNGVVSIRGSDHQLEEVQREPGQNSNQVYKDTLWLMNVQWGLRKQNWPLLWLLVVLCKNGILVVDVGVMWFSLVWAEFGEV